MFMVAVDVLDPTIDLQSLKELMRTKSEIRAWWNHIPGCFLIATDWDANRLTDEVRHATHDARLLVMQVDPSVSEGWLPERSWQWIRRRATEEAG
jgi:hypothetical protein